jgi:hypothetical protein
MTRRLGIVLVALGLVASGCGSRVRQDVWDNLDAQNGGTTATTGSGGDDQSSDTGNDTTDATDTTGTTVAHQHTSGRGGSATATTVAGALPAPANGTYTYDESAGNQKRTTTESWSAQRQSDSVALTSVITEDEGGDKVTTRTKYRVTKSVFEMLSDTSTYNDEEPDACTYKPPVEVLQLPLKVGAKWHAKAVCEGDDPADADDTSYEVTGTANDVIGGTPVKTFVVRSSESFDSTDETTGKRTTFTTTDTRHIDPSTLLVVTEDVSFDFGDGATTVHRQLRSLTPA